MRQPTIYVPHGGGPWPWMEDMSAGMAPLRAWLERLPDELPEPPTALLCVSAHWEAEHPTVGSGARPPTYHDYYGFPEHTYRIRWPAAGAPELAARVRTLLGEAGIDSAEDAERGFDHGTFVPLALAWPDAEVPTVQLSLVRGLDPATHLAIGRVLRPLRDEGVLILGSGMSYHNMLGFRAAMGGGTALAGPRADSATFDAWLGIAVQGEDREEKLRRWAEAPAARACHPREEHLLPLMVVAGASDGEPATLPFRGDVLGMRVSAVRYG